MKAAQSSIRAIVVTNGTRTTKLEGNEMGGHWGVKAVEVRITIPQ